MSEMNLTINVSTYPTGEYNFEIDVIENYESDKYHVVVYEREDTEHNTNYNHHETVGLDTWGQLYKYLKDLTNNTIKLLSLIDANKNKLDKNEITLVEKVLDNIDKNIIKYFV